MVHNKDLVMGRMFANFSTFVFKDEIVFGKLLFPLSASPELAPPSPLSSFSYPSAGSITPPTAILNV